MQHRTQRGFSLIELLIVVALILIIAAIAIPNLMRSRMSANEASAVGCVRTVNTAETTYEVAYPMTGYADNLTKLGYPASGPVSSAAAGLLDFVIGCAQQPCVKSGYQFQIVNASGTPVSTYSIVATPATVGQTGNRGFCSSQLTSLTYDPNGGTNCTLAIQ